MKKILEYHGIVDNEQVVTDIQLEPIEARLLVPSYNENSPEMFENDFNFETDQMEIEAPKLPQSYLPDALIPHIAIAGKILKKT
jgi:hypothetical protein